MRSSKLNIHFGEKHIKNVLARFEIENLATTLLYVVAKFSLSVPRSQLHPPFRFFLRLLRAGLRLGDAADYHLVLARAYEFLDADGLGHGWQHRRFALRRMCHVVGHTVDVWFGCCRDGRVAGH